MAGSAYISPAQPCRGVTRLGVRCRRTTRNPSGWCGHCDGTGRDEPPLGGTLTGDEIGAGPDPLSLGDRRAAVADRPLVTARRARWLLFKARLRGDGNAVALALAAGDHGPLAADARLLLSDHPDWQVRGAVIEHADTTPAELWRALGDPSRRVVLAAAGHPNLPAEAADGLLSNSSRMIRAAAATNPACPPGALRRAAHLALTGDRELLINVAANPSTPADIVAGLARGDISPSPASRAARLAALRNPRCPPATLAEIAADPNSSPEIRAAAAGNPNCPSAARAVYGLEAD